ncbi:hypothetical protein [uncultured Capnocytophaga sp.]|jgi:hypothetical protein|uniref:hypothetical protein n=1 Tax=uncultured Capnocytophaga sp. TaxID=159273 RepID=UPI00206868E8|nr:hypothetical protein [uncultured Capnocytophaga sp.]DAT71334.1 MAG TPA: Translation initiation factor IF-2, N-terminal region [Caudoviricetes sp.]
MEIFLKKDVKEEIKKKYVGRLAEELRVTPKAIYDRLYRNSDSLTHYSTLLVLENILKKPIDQLIDINRC